MASRSRTMLRNSMKIPRRRSLTSYKVRVAAGTTKPPSKPVPQSAWLVSGGCSDAPQPLFTPSTILLRSHIRNLFRRQLLSTCFNYIKARSATPPLRTASVLRQDSRGLDDERGAGGEKLGSGDGSTSVGDGSDGGDSRFGSGGAVGSFDGSTTLTSSHPASVEALLQASPCAINCKRAVLHLPMQPKIMYIIVISSAQSDLRAPVNVSLGCSRCRSLSFEKPLFRTHVHDSVIHVR